MKNIALIVPSLKGGGAEKVASLLSIEFAKKHRVWLILFDGEGIVYPYEGTMVDLNLPASRTYLGKALNVFKRIYKVRKIKKKHRIQVSLSFLSSANIVNVVSRSNDKVILSVHNDPSRRRVGFWQRRVYRILYEKADKVVAVSKGVGKILGESYGISPDRIITIYNPVDTQEVVKLVDLKQDCNERFSIVNVGRLTHAKGQWHLIRALVDVREEIPDIKLFILGEGELRGYLQDLIRSLNLEEHVFLMGHQDRPFEYMSAADVFVFPSISEGFGNVVVEALACGVPVISSDCRFGPREILAPLTDPTEQTKEISHEEYGILVPVCDGRHYDATVPLTIEERKLAKSIVDLLSDSELRELYSRRGKMRAYDFDIKEISNKWGTLFE